MNILRRSLFLQFYATVIAGLALVTILLVAMAGIGQFDRRDTLSNRMGNFIGAFMPPPGTSFNLDRFVHRMSDAVNANITIYDSKGKLLAHAGPPLPADTPAEDPAGFHPGGRTFTFTTPDGLHVVGRNRLPHGPFRRNMALLILLIAGVLGLVAYPVTRRLTRRLENLRQGMTHWSEGALDSRVAVEGDDEIADVARSFNRAAERIEELVTAQKSLLANASHELRSPLARLRMAIEMFEDAPTDRLKSEIVGNLRELDELVEEILLMSRLESKQPDALDDDCDLLAIAAEESARFKDVTVSGEQSAIKGNRKLLTRLTRNLIHNALRHGKPPVEVSVTRDGNKTILSVRDHGAGLSAEEAERIFEPFYRPQGHGESAGGWGLGLALVSQIADLHNGKASYQTVTEGGAKFVVELG